MQSDPPKLVFLLGGLGNQLWLAAYSHYLIEHGHRVRIDTSWYHWSSFIFFGTTRLRRQSYASLVSLVIPNAIISCSIVSLIRLRIISFCHFIFPDDIFDRLLYRQDDNYVSESFLISLSAALDQCVSFSSDHKAYLASMTALHLRLGDRGFSLSDDETFALKQLLVSLQSTDSLLLFSDYPSEAFEIVSSLSSCIVQIAPSYADDSHSLFALSLCKSRVSVRPSTFLQWAQKLSSFV